MKKTIVILSLLILCLSLWGCSANDDNINHLAQKQTRPSYSSNSQQSNSTIKLDPNGFSSLEQLVKAYVDMQTCAITEEQFRKIYPEFYWEEVDFEEEYFVIVNCREQWQKSIKTFGENFNISYKIVGKEVTYDGSKASYSATENEEHLQVYGVGIKERTEYRVILSITLKGSERVETRQPGIFVVKIGNKWYGY